MKRLIEFVKDWRNQSKYLKWMLYYSKPYIPKIIFLLILDLSGTFLTVSLAIVSKQIIDTATTKGLQTSALFLYVGIVAATLIITVTTQLLSILVNEKFSFGIRKQLFDKIIHSHWMDVNKYHTGDLMTRLTSDAGSIADGIVWVIPTIIRLFVELIITFFTLFYYEPTLAIFALLIAPVAATMSFWLGRKLKKMQIKVQESEAAYRSYLQESLSNLLIVKAFANEEYAIKRLCKLRDERFYWVLKKNRLGIISTATMSLSFHVGYIGAFTFGALQLSKNLITYGTMSVFLTLVNRVQAPVMSLAQNIPKVVSIIASAGRIMDLQNIPLEEKTENQITPVNIGVSIDNLTFGYTNETVLEDASLNIRAGEFVAIVGESGIGKTTLVRIIMSFMSSVNGTILFRNDMGEVEQANAGSRQFISYVPQGNTLFSGTIRENIQMGKLDAKDAEVIQALKLASAYEFVCELPEGIDTVIGERGHGLSEGQAQRIAIARAFVRRAPFLILDEATSALDEKTELAVMEGMKQLTPKPTCLVITHRRSVLAYCDREICIEGKKIV